MNGIKFGSFTMKRIKDVNHLEKQWNNISYHFFILTKYSF